MQGITVPIIFAIVYIVLQTLKNTIKNPIFNNLIPVLAMVLGATLGVVAFYAVPDLILSHNPLQAIMLGISSGLSATGTNQILKQIKELIDNNNTKPQSTTPTDTGSPIDTNLPTDTTGSNSSTDTAD